MAFRVVCASYWFALKKKMIAQYTAQLFRTRALHTIKAAIEYLS